MDGGALATELELRRVERRRTWQQVVDQLESQILHGHLKPGDRLLGERQLAEQLGVGRPSVREALRVLEALDFLRVRTGTGEGSGSIIVEEEPTAGGAMSTLLRLHVGLSHFSMADVIETRILIETWAVRMAASRMGRADLDEMALMLRRMEDRSVSREEFNDLDTKFHVGLGRSSGNGLVAYLMHAIRDAIQIQMVHAFDNVTDWWAATEGPRHEHAAVLGALSVHDGEGAARLLENHIRAFYSRSLATDQGQKQLTTGLPPEQWTRSPQTPLLLRGGGRAGRKR